MAAMLGPSFLAMDQQRTGNMKLALTAAACCLAIAGCAGLAEKDCRSDWYQLGLRDGQRGDPPEPESYAAQCRPYGVQPDAARYLQGWEAGFGWIHLREKYGS